MFSSLASLIFGSNTSATTNSGENNQPRGQRQEQVENENLVRTDARNTINVTSLTPSVTGSSTLRKTVRNKPNKFNYGKHNQGGAQKSASAIAQFFASSESSDEDDWCIVEKEDEGYKLPNPDSEEGKPIIYQRECKIYECITRGQTSQKQQYQRRRQHFNSRSGYSGPRPQQQLNYLPIRSRTAGRRVSPHRNAYGNADVTASDSSDSANREAPSHLFQMCSLPPTSHQLSPGSSDSSGSGGEFGANIGMEESWFITPPPCFLSVGPINVIASPYENLLIEHPSMSVYRSIRSSEEVTESFVNLDIGTDESSSQRPRAVAAAAVSAMDTTEELVAERDAQAAVPQQPRGTNARADRFTSAQLKQELFARNTQKNHDKNERQYLCRGAINRSNKARDYQSRGNRQRRSDMQHCKLLSGANNNRKCH